MANMLVSILVFLLIVAVCTYIYNLLLAPALGRRMPMIPLVDLLVLLLLIGIVIFALQSSGLWDKLMMMGGGY